MTNNNIGLNLLTSFTNLSKTKFIHQTKHLKATQNQFLFKLLRLYQDTELGHKFDFRTIKTIQEFQDRIPISNYSYYEPYIKRMMEEGENNLLTPESPIYFNFTSGTTAKQKIIPVTKRSRQFKELNKLIAISFFKEAARKANIIIDKSLLTSSVQLFGHTKNGIPFGPVSVGDFHLANFWQKNFFIHPYAALEIKDILARNYVCLLFALSNPNQSIISANYPIIALILAEYLEKYASELIEDLKTGKIANWLQIEPELRRKLEKKWQAYPLRAKQLEDILRKEGRLTPKLAWPSLGCIVTARGTPSNFYFQRFPDYFGDIPIFGGLYVSAEAVFGIYSEFDNDGSILAINSSFFEFIPCSEWEKENPQTLLSDQVKVGEEYRIVVTNYTGLYRYDIGDIIKVVGFYHDTPIITFLYRAKGILSSTTEKTTDFHVIKAMQELQQEFKLSLKNFCVTLSEDGFPPAYILNMELCPHHSLNEPEKFLAQFDLKIQNMNTCYQIERKSAIPSPRLRILAPGSFAQLSQSLIKKGMPESQVKILNINQDRQYLSRLEVIQEFKLL